MLTRCELAQDYFCSLCLDYNDKVFSHVTVDHVHCMLKYVNVSPPSISWENKTINILFNKKSQ